MSRIAARLLWPVIVVQASATAYLAAMTALAATDRRPCSLRAGSGNMQLAVVIPAHDEESMLSGILSALSLQTFSRDRFSVHVIADNCTDGTAAIARSFDVEVHERNDPAHPGKGQALAWLLPRLLETNADAFVFLDADSTVEPQFLQVLAAHLEGGELALQVSYRVAEPDSSSLVALRALAFTLMHEVRGRAKSRLGASCGLWGNGMALHRQVLSKAGWSSFSSVEDAEQHLRLILSGTNVTFVPEARVWGYMPATYRAAESQQKRWEAGRLNLLRTWWRPLLNSAIAKRNRSAAVALCDLAVPPLSVLGLSGAVALIASWLLGSANARVVAVLSAFGLTVHVLAGLPVSGLKPRSYRAVFQLPRFVMWKCWLYAREFQRRKDSAWLRTSRR